MVAVLQYTTIIKIGAQRAQRSLFAQPSIHTIGIHTIGIHTGTKVTQP